MSENKSNPEGLLGLAAAAVALIAIPIIVNMSREPAKLVIDGDSEIAALVRDVDDFWAQHFAIAFPTAPAPYSSPSVRFVDTLQAPLANVFEPAGLYTPRFQTIKVLNDGGYTWMAHVVAHEFGHHVQHLAGLNSALERNKALRWGGDAEADMFYELQAECFAGVYAADAAPRGQVMTIEMVERRLSQEALSTDSETHGSARQRFDWFKRGYSAGDVSACMGDGAPEVAGAAAEL